MSKTKYDLLREDMENLRDEVRTDIGRLEGKIDKLVGAIKGDGEFGNEGLVSRVKRNEKWIEQQRYLWAKIYGGIAVSSGLAVWLMKLLDII